MSKKPDDAARIAGMASILKLSNKPVNPSPAPPAAEPEPSRPAAEMGKPERVGKYRDPAFKATSIYVRKDTLKAVRRKLEDLEPDKDLSELAEELFREWVATH